MTVEEAEIEQALQLLPEWRRPYGALAHPIWSADTEGDGIHSALLDLLTETPQTFDELAAGVRSEWGEAASALIRAQLRCMVSGGEAGKTVDGYVRREA